MLRRCPSCWRASTELVLKPAFPDGITHPVFLSRLSSAARDEWRRRIQAEPARWVAQEELAISTAPVLVEDAGEGASWRRAAGAAHLGAADVRGQRHRRRPPGDAGGPGAGGGQRRQPRGVHAGGIGQQGRLGDGRRAGGGVQSAAAAQPPRRLDPGVGDLPSQTADNLFWLGRYAERAEGIARLARVLLRLLEQGPAEASRAGSTGAEPTELLRALAAFADPGGAPPPIPLPTGRQAALRTVMEAIRDSQRSSSLVSVSDQVISVARLVRDRLSADSWRVLAALADQLSDELSDDRVSEARLRRAELVAGLGTL